MNPYIFRAWLKPNDVSEPLIQYRMAKTEDSILRFEPYYENKETFLNYDFFVPFVDSRWILEQYTGFKDNQLSEEYPEGKFIFMGDILQCFYQENESPHYIVANQRNIQRILESHNNVYVIGNIHENPEYLTFFKNRMFE